MSEYENLNVLASYHGPRLWTNSRKTANKLLTRVPNYCTYTCQWNVSGEGSTWLVEQQQMYFLLFFNMSQYYWVNIGGSWKDRTHAFICLWLTLILSLTFELIVHEDEVLTVVIYLSRFIVPTNSHQTHNCFYNDIIHELNNASKLFYDWNTFFLK